MGAGGVTVAGVDLTAKAEKDAFEVEFQANRLNGICAFRFKDDHLVVGGDAIDIREQDELLVTDDGNRIYGGRIATVEPFFDGNTIYWQGKAVSFDTLLDERIIENGVRDANLLRYDDDDVAWIIGHHSELTTDYVSRIRTLTLPTIDYTGMTLRKALATLSSYTTGAVFWIDQNKRTHWTDPTASQIVLNPDWDSGDDAHWTLDAAAVVTADAGPGSTGDYALVTTGSGAGMHETIQTVTGITGSARYMFAVWLWSSVASKAQVRLDWQNVGSVSQRVDVLTNSGATSTWAAYHEVYTAPASAVKVVIRLGGVNNFTGTVRHDGLGLVRETAAWGVDTTPDGSTTFAPLGWNEPRNATVPINRVFVKGNGISGWREHAGSIAYYKGKKFEGFISDDRVTTEDGINSRAAATFRKYAYPSRTGTYGQTQSGLSAGTWQIINMRPLNRLSIEWIATLRVYWLGNGNMLYAVTYGEAEEDVGSGLLAAQNAYNGTDVQPGVEDPGTIVSEALADMSAAGANLVRNSSFDDTIGSEWTVDTGWAITTVADAFWGAKVARATLAGATALPLITEKIAVNRNDDYWVSAWSFMRSYTSGTGLFEMREYDGANNLLATTVIGSITAAETTWTRHKAHFGPTVAAGGRLAFNASTTKIAVAFRSDGAATCAWDVDAVQVERGGLISAYAPRPQELIDGVITTTKIADDAITTPKIAALAITAGEIAANAITAVKIDTKAVTADKIDSGAITTVKLAVGGVATGNLLRNGSFEDAEGNATSEFVIDSALLAGWTVGTDTKAYHPSGSGFERSGNRVSYVGRYTGTPTAVSVYQRVPVIPGRRYRLTGWYAMQTRQIVGAEVTGQRNTNSNGGATTLTLTYPTTPTEGDLLIVGLAWRGDATINAVPDGWALAKAGGNGAGIDSAIYYKVAGAAEPTAPQWGFSASVKSGGVATEFSGVAAAPLDKSNNNTNTGTAGTTGATGVLSQADEIVVTLFSNINTSTWSAHDNGQTEVGEIASTGGSVDTRNDISLARKIVSSTASVDYGATLSASQVWSAAVATFKTLGPSTASARLVAHALSKTLAVTASDVIVSDATSGSTLVAATGTLEYMAPIDGSVSYLEVHCQVQGSPTTGVGVFEDVDLRYADLTSADGNVVINGTGITVTDGKITVTNGSSVIVIDGESNMFKIIASGSLSVEGITDGSDMSSGVTFSAWGALASIKAWLSFSAVGTGATEWRRLSTLLTRRALYASLTSGGATDDQFSGIIETYAYWQGYLDGSSYMYLSLHGCNYSGGANINRYGYYHVLKEIAQ